MLDNRPRLRKLLRSATLLLAAFGLLFAASLWFHESLLEWIAGRIVPAQVRIEGVHLGNPLRIDHVALRDREDTGAPAFLEAEQLSLELNLGAVRRLKILRLERLTLNMSELPERNYDFVSALINAPASTVDPTPYLPEILNLPNIALQYTSAAGVLHLEGLSAHGTVSALDKLSLAVKSGSVNGTWQKADAQATPQEIRGAVEIGLDVDGGEVSTALRLELPGLAALNGDGKVQRNPALSAGFVLAPGSLSGPVWSQWLSSQLGYPVHFESLTLAGGKVEAVSGPDGLVFESLSFEAESPAITLGPADAPHFSGPLAATLQGATRDGAAGTVQLRSGKGTPVELALASNEAGIALTLKDTTWDRAQWEEVLPSFVADLLPWWPGLRGATLSGALHLGQDPAVLTATLMPETTDQGGASLSLEARFPSGEPVNATLNGSRKGAGDWSLEYTGAVDNSWSAELQLDAADSSVWLRDVLGYAWHAGEDLRISGNAAYASGGDATLDAKFTQADAAVGTLKMTKGKVDLATATASLPLKASADLSALAALTGLADLRGQLVAGMTIQRASGRLRVDDLKATLKAPGFGGGSLPEDAEVALSGKVAQQPDGAMLLSGTATWDDQFSLDMSGARWNAADASWSVESITGNGSAALFTGLGLLDSGDFAMQLTGTGLSHAADVYTGTASATIAGNLITTGGLLAAKALQAELSGNLAEGVSAAGPLRAGELAALGVTLHDTTARLRMAWPKVYVEELSSTVFGGTVRGGGEVDLAAENFPVVVDLTLENTDLARFTEEFKPPNNVKLTGLVSGTIRASIAGESITDLAVDLKSGEAFTLDRATVAQMLMSQEIGEISGSGLADKIVKSVVGDEDVRPFTGAELRLGLEDGRITGAALLTSKALNLTVDIHADQQALFEAIRMRQEGQIANFTTTLN